MLQIDQKYLVLCYIVYKEREDATGCRTDHGESTKGCHFKLPPLIKVLLYFVHALRQCGDDSAR